MARARLKGLLIAHEGMVLKPYKDTEGYTTIGVGRCLDTTGISKQEAMVLLENDIAKSEEQARTFPWYKDLNEARQDVVISMIFNLGLNGFRKFKRMIAAIEHGDYAEAGNQMLNSQWSIQVGNRSLELAQMMVLGR